MANLSLDQQQPKPTRHIGDFIRKLLLWSEVITTVWALVTFTPLGSWLSAAFPADSRITWHLSRSTATVAYLLLTGSVAWGLILTTKIIKEITPPPLVLGLHTWLSWVAIVLGGFHAFLLLFDTYYTYTLAHLLIPFIGPYRPGAVGLGTLSLYLMILTSASFSWRSWLGQKRWRMLHYLTFVAYTLVTVHGVLSGTDSGDLGMRAMYIGSVSLVLFLTNYRLLAGQKQRKEMAGLAS